MQRAPISAELPPSIVEMRRYLWFRLRLNIYENKPETRFVQAITQAPWINGRDCGRRARIASTPMLNQETSSSRSAALPKRISFSAMRSIDFRRDRPPRSLTRRRHIIAGIGLRHADDGRKFANSIRITRRASFVWRRHFALPSGLIRPTRYWREL